MVTVCAARALLHRAPVGFSSASPGTPLSALALALAPEGYRRTQRAPRSAPNGGDLALSGRCRGALLGRRLACGSRREAVCAYARTHTPARVQHHGHVLEEGGRGGVPGLKEEHLEHDLARALCKALGQPLRTCGARERDRDPVDGEHADEAPQHSAAVEARVGGGAGAAPASRETGAEPAQNEEEHDPVPSPLWRERWAVLDIEAEAG
eukprot:7378751-Prymnesium_polylepis.1